MRINLNCPFAEKDECRKLGGRWDGARRTWYIENVEDLTPFMGWMVQAPMKKKGDRHAPKTTGGAFVPSCNCDVLPWEDCEHTAEVDGDALRMLRNLS